jgi:hypothetical protein
MHCHHAGCFGIPRSQRLALARIIFDLDESPADPAAEERLGLGDRFWREVDAHIRWILANPVAARLRRGDYRRVNLEVFPYYIAYAIRGMSNPAEPEPSGFSAGGKRSVASSAAPKAPTERCPPPRFL